MRVRRVEVENFRGIKTMDFRVPSDKKFVCLIGPGDSTKSTIIEAIFLALGERWSLSIADTDFHHAKVDVPIVIRVALADLPQEIRTHSLLGLHLAGIDDEGEWQHDAFDGLDPCVIVQLTIDQDMDPTWSIYRPGDTDLVPIGSGIRRRFAVFKVDDRIDNHLRWTRTSALTRITDSSHGTSGTLAAALIAARGAVAASVTPELQTLTDAIGSRLGRVGSGTFAALKPGLDTSLASSGGNLALFEGEVPLTNYGLGTRRLAGIAAQEMASEDKSVILIDEVEYGLEPHRLVHLLKHLRSDNMHAQVFVTTHSSVAIEQLEAANLAIVRCSDGQVNGGFVPAGLNFAQAALRGGPSSFLAKRIIVTEGKTEFGLLLGMIEHWDNQASVTGTPTSAAHGIAVTDGNGSNAPNRANVLSKLGYDVALFVDNDARGIDAAVAEASGNGVQVFRWQLGHATENELVSSLGAAELSELLQVAVETRVDAVTVRSDLLNVSPSGPAVPNLDVASWISTGAFTLDSARQLIAKAALRSKWFKSVSAGQALSQFIRSNATILRHAPFGVTFMALKAYIYPSTPAPEEVQTPEAE